MLHFKVSGIKLWSILLLDMLVRLLPIITYTILQKVQRSNRRDWHDLYFEESNFHRLLLQQISRKKIFICYFVLISQFFLLTLRSSSPPFQSRGEEWRERRKKYKKKINEKFAIFFFHKTTTARIYEIQ